MYIVSTVSNMAHVHCQYSEVGQGGVTLKFEICPADIKILLPTGPPSTADCGNHGTLRVVTCLSP